MSILLKNGKRATESCQMKSAFGNITWAIRRDDGLFYNKRTKEWTTIPYTFSSKDAADDVIKTNNL